MGWLVEQRHCCASLAVIRAREGEERRANSSRLHRCAMAPIPLHAHNDNNNNKYFFKKREKTINFAGDLNSGTHAANVKPRPQTFQKGKHVGHTATQFKTRKTKF